jgi:hypothetical protein
MVARIPSKVLDIIALAGVSFCLGWGVHGAACGWHFW